MDLKMNTNTPTKTKRPSNQTSWYEVTYQDLQGKKHIKVYKTRSPHNAIMTCESSMNCDKVLQVVPIPEPKKK